jgi:hypothetical protein
MKPRLHKIIIINHILAAGTLYVRGCQTVGRVLGGGAQLASGGGGVLFL